MKPVFDWSSVPVVVDCAWAARVLGVCPETIKRLCQAGTLTATNINGRGWRISKDVLKNFVEGARND